MFRFVIQNGDIEHMACPENSKNNLSTLSHNLNLSEYEKIIILDDDGINTWCQHETMKLRCNGREVVLIQVPAFKVWANIYRQFQSISSKHFYSVISENQKNDEFFNRFRYFLQSLHENISQDMEYAVSMFHLCGYDMVEADGELAIETIFEITILMSLFVVMLVTSSWYF